MDEKPCVFCERKNFESRIVHETKLFFVVASKGQITDSGYVLIIPKYHLSCMAEMHDTKAGAFLALMEDVNRAIENEYGLKATLFEHGGIGQTIPHAHLHILPANIDKDMGKILKRDFPTAEVDAFIKHYDWLFTLYENYREPYLFWQGQYDFSYVCWSPPAAPQYFRKVVAELLGRPERADWKKMDPELDQKLIAETVARLKPHFKPH